MSRPSRDNPSSRNSRSFYHRRIFVASSFPAFHIHQWRFLRSRSIISQTTRTQENKSNFMRESFLIWCKISGFSQTPLCCLLHRSFARNFGWGPSSIHQIAYRKLEPCLNPHWAIAINRTDEAKRKVARIYLIYFLLNEQPSVKRALPPVGWQRTVEHPAQMTTVWAWLKTVVMVKHPGHLTSMKKDLGAGTSCYSGKKD